MKKPRKSKPTKKSRAVTVNVKSGATGITHVFSDLDIFEKLARELEQKESVERTIRLATALKFWDWLSGRSITEQPNYILSTPIFRTCFNGYNPLDISGNLASGGRFNVGGAQIHNSFNIGMEACLYGADSLACTLSEVGPLVKSPENYELTPINDLHLWDLATVINNLDQQSHTTAHVKNMVDSLPMNANWVLQKLPATSQLLAHRLRTIGGDGLIYPSVKHNGGKVIAVFVKDAHDAKSKFTIRTI